MYPDYYTYLPWAINILLIGTLIWFFIRNNEGTKRRSEVVKRLYSFKTTFIDKEGYRKDEWELEDDYKGFKFYYKANIKGRIKKIENGKIDVKREIVRLEKIKEHHIEKLNSKAVYNDSQLYGLQEQIDFINIQIDKIIECNPKLDSSKTSKSFDQYFTESFTSNSFQQFVTEHLYKKDKRLNKSQLSRFCHYLIEINLLKYPIELKGKEAIKFGEMVLDFLNEDYKGLAKGVQEFDSELPQDKHKNDFKAKLLNGYLDSI